MSASGVVATPFPTRQTKRDRPRPFPESCHPHTDANARRQIVTLAVTNARRYSAVAIKNFRNVETRDLFDGKRVRRWINIETAAMRKLAMLNRAARLADLRIPPANRLEALKGERAGQHSIRINDQFRICFRWRDGDAHDVEIVDYH